MQNDMHDTKLQVMLDLMDTGFHRYDKKGKSCTTKRGRAARQKGEELHDKKGKNCTTKGEELHDNNRVPRA